MRHIPAEQVLSRAAGAPLVDGNAVALLVDAAGNYPAWLQAIAGAERFVHFESYIVHDDAAGALFADALVDRARAGVRVRVVHDWLGALGATPRQFWYRLVDAGVEVRVFNPPTLWRPLAWMARDHRKMLAVDGRVAFVSGLCVGEAWTGTATTPPWRDTGVAIHGPAVADVHAEFGAMWAALGPPLPVDELPARDAIAPAGDVALRVIGSRPGETSVMRLDALVASLARERLWITDAYFVGVPGYVQALTAASADGVDVRLLVPGNSDLPWVRAFSRAGYRSLLAGGVRVFEWNGSMVHAKTAVADGRWARVGSSDLNLQSWMGNWELDVTIEDAGFGAAMEQQFLADLANTTEVVLPGAVAASRLGSASTSIPAGTAPAEGRGGRGPHRGAPSGRAAASALRLGHTVSAALAATRPLGAAEAPTLFTGGLALMGLAALAAWKPAWLAWPLAAGAAWLGLSLLGAAWRVRAGKGR